MENLLNKYLNRAIKSVVFIAGVGLTTLIPNTAKANIGGVVYDSPVRSSEILEDTEIISAEGAEVKVTVKGHSPDDYLMDFVRGSPQKGYWIIDERDFDHPPSLDDTLEIKVTKEIDGVTYSANFATKWDDFGEYVPPLFLAPEGTNHLSVYIKNVFGENADSSLASLIVNDDTLATAFVEKDMPYGAFANLAFNLTENPLGVYEGAPSWEYGDSAKVVITSKNGLEAISKAILDSTLGNVQRFPDCSLRTPASISEYLNKNNNINKISNYPNPTNSNTNISILMETSSEVKLGIYDIEGKLVSSKNGFFHPSSNNTLNYNWNLEDLSGNKVPSGTYIVSVKIGNEIYQGNVVVPK